MGRDACSVQVKTIRLLNFFVRIANCFTFDSVGVSLQLMAKLRIAALSVILQRTTVNNGFQINDIQETSLKQHLCQISFLLASSNKLCTCTAFTSFLPDLPLTPTHQIFPFKITATLLSTTTTSGMIMPVGTPTPTSILISRTHQALEHLFHHKTWYSNG